LICTSTGQWVDRAGGPALPRCKPKMAAPLLYSEAANAIGTGWSNTEVTNVGSAGKVHGPWGQKVHAVTKSIHIPDGVMECTVTWRSWAANTRDGEADRLFLNGHLVWQKNARIYQRGCRNGWQTGPADFPHTSKASPSCFIDVSVKAPCAHTLEVKFVSGVDQAESNEAWAFRGRQR
jgi:hypothetical protein